MSAKRGRSQSLGPNRSPSTKRCRRGRSTPPADRTPDDPGDEEFPKTLGYPIRSPVDPKRYKVILLENGLKAILISDCEFMHEQHAKVQTDSNCLDKQIANFNKNILFFNQNGRECKIGKCDKAPNQDQDEGGGSKKRNCGTKSVGSASVALYIGGGSFNDPENYPGLAHFCEHVSLLKSGKYPTEAEFAKQLAILGVDGLNGTTFGDSTRFTFDMEGYDLENFLTVLDMFVSLFTHPFITLDCVKKERQLVDSEFEDKRHIESEWRSRTLQLTTKKGHPIGKFNWGNYSTLQGPNGDDEKLLEIVKQFHKDNFSAERMTLAIEMPERLEVIQKVTAQYFTQLPNTGISKPITDHQLLPFDTPEFRKLYYVKTVEATDDLYISWELPAESWKNFRVRPTDFMSKLFNNQSPGSLVEHLRRRCLISHLNCYVGDSNYDKTEYSGLFHIRFALTKLGTRSIEMILEATFAYIKYITHHEVRLELFRELQTLSALQFHFNDENGSLELGSAMRTLPPQYVLIGNVLPTLWDSDVIKEYLGMLTPSNANLMIMSDTLEFCKQVEPYFQFAYHAIDIPQTLMERMENPKLISSFANAQPIKFVPKNFCLVPDPEDSGIPTVVFKNSKLLMWHTIGQIEAASAHFYFAFKSELGNESIQKGSMMDLFSKIIMENLATVLCGVTETQTTYSLNKTEAGIIIHVSGFSHKLANVANCIIDNVLSNDNITKDKFETGKNLCLDEYVNQSLNPESLNRDLMTRVISGKSWMDCELHTALKLVHFEMFKSFTARFKATFRVICFVQGNISCNKAIRFAERLSDKLKCHHVAYGLGTYSKPRANSLPLGETILRVKNMNSKIRCSYISNFYEIGKASMENILLSEMIVSEMNAAAFMQLRETEKMCYSVDVNNYTIGGKMIGICIGLRTRSHRFFGNFVKERIDSFVRQFFELTIKPMRKKEFENLKGKQVLTGPGSHDSTWNKIISETYDFDTVISQRATIDRMEVRDLQAWYQTHLLPGGGETQNCYNSSIMKKLSTQVVGNHDQEFSIEKIQNLGNERAGLNRGLGEELLALQPLECPLNLIILLPHYDEELQKRCIGDLFEFLRTMYSYPPS